MTLPRGFGSGTCFECGRPRKFGEICVCQTKDTPSTKEINIPLTKDQFQLYIWYGLFWTLASLAIFTTVFIHIVFIVFVFFVFIIGSLAGATLLDCIGYKPSRTKQQVFPWFTPFFNIKTRVKFKDDQG